MRLHQVMARVVRWLGQKGDRMVAARSHALRSLVAFSLLLFLLPLVPAAPVAAAATITVNDTGDTTTAGDGRCTLREALNNVNLPGQTTGGDCAAGTGTGDTIAFQAGLGTITVTGTLPLVTKPLTIAGNGPGSTVITGSSLGADVFRVALPSGTAAFIGMTITPLMEPSIHTGAGISIFSSTGSSTVTVTNCTFTAGGSGIYNVPSSTGDTTLTVTNSTFSNNNEDLINIPVHAGGAGATPVTVTNSTFANSGNAAIENGGLSPTTLTITNSTIYNSTGNGIINEGQSATPSTIFITNTTIAGNKFGIQNPSGGSHSLTVTNSIVAGNSTNCLILSGAITDGGNNLEYGVGAPASSCPFTTNAVHADPLLGTLANYGGLTQTLPLLPGSAAIDAGDSSTCQNTNGTAPVAGKDQRGVSRPVNACDIGAFESKGFSLSPVSGSTPQSTPVFTAFPHALALTVTANDAGEPVNGGVVSFSAPSSGPSATFSAPTAPITGGQASVTATANGTAGGPYNITASASGATNTTFALTNTAAATTTALASGTNPSTPGQSVTLTATVSGTGGTPTGTVDFKEGTTTLGSGTLVGGTATFVTSALAAGTHPITATYNGDTTFAGSTSSTVSQVVNQATTTTTLTSNPNPSTFGQSVTLTATVSATGGTPTGTVDFNDNGTVITGCTSQALSGGQATCTISTLSIGSHLLTATYSGDTTFAPSTVTQTVTQFVIKVATSTTLTSGTNPSTLGQSVTFTATVSGSGGTPTGSVTFKDNGTDLLGCVGRPLSGGQATCILSSLSIGTHPTTAFYSGDSTFTTSTSDALTQTVNQATSSTALTSGTNPSTFGQSVTFTATVSGSGGTPTGSVAFKDNGTTLTNCGSQSLMSGVATCTTGSLTAGTHPITAVYSGDTNYAGGTSITVTQTVNQAGTSTSVTSTSPNPSTAGQSVIFTATVSVSSPGSGTPTGTVAFKDNGTDITGCTSQSLTSGQATCATSTLTAGDHTIIAVYSGDTNFTTSTSPGYLQHVVVIATKFVVSGYPTTTVAGDSHTVTVTATDNSGTTATGYTGTVTVTTSDSQAVIQAAHTLTNGTGTFTATFKTVGTQSITATDGGITGNQTGIQVTPAAANAITVTVGNNQHATVGTAFTTNLQTTVVDAYSNPVPNVTVTFTAPGSGASGTFAAPGSGITASVTTNASGIATAPTLTANFVAGSVTVTASVAGVATPASFSLTNDAPTITLSAISPSTATVGVAFPNQTLTAAGTGSTAPYTFAVTVGALPAGLTLDTTGLLHGTPTAGGSFPFTVTATDSHLFTGTQAYTLTVAPATIVLAPMTLPLPVYNVAYSQTITATGGTSPYAFTTTGPLPAGLIFDTTGLLHGTPTSVGPFSFTVTATDSSTGTGAPYTGSQAYTGTVATPTITLAPTTLPGGAAEHAYSQQLSASGGAGAYTFATTGPLPTGITLDPTGLVHGTPTVAGSFPFDVTATDAHALTGVQHYTLLIAAPTLTLAPTSLPGGVKAVAYAPQTLTVSGGITPYAFTVTTGALPAGLTLNPTTGVLSGTPTAIGSTTFTVTATDPNGFTGSQAYTLTITAAPLTSIALTCGGTPATVPAGGTGQCKAIGTYADGSTQDLTSQVTYTSDNAAVAKVDANGKITAGPQPGTATITVTVGSVTMTLVVTVTLPSITGIVPPGQRPTGASAGTPAAPPAPDNRGSGAPAAPPGAITGR